MKYVPLANRVIIRAFPLTKEEKTINGLEVPDSAIPLRRGEVVGAGIGERAIQSGELIPMELKSGDKVVFLTEAAYVPIRVGNEELRLMRENHVECVIEE